jgi:hypothetical protein
VYKTGLQDLTHFLNVLEAASPKQKQLMKAFLYKAGKAAPLEEPLTLDEARNELFELLDENSRKFQTPQQFIPEILKSPCNSETVCCRNQ